MTVSIFLFVLQFPSYTRLPILRPLQSKLFLRRLTSRKRGPYTSCAVVLITMQSEDGSEAFPVCGFSFLFHLDVVYFGKRPSQKDTSRILCWSCRRIVVALCTRQGLGSTARFLVLLVLMIRRMDCSRGIAYMRRAEPTHGPTLLSRIREYILWLLLSIQRKPSRHPWNYCTDI